MIVPPGWTFDQYGTAALKLESQGAMIWFYASEEEREDTEAPLRRMAERADPEESSDLSPWKVRGARAASRSAPADPPRRLDAGARVPQRAAGGRDRGGERRARRPAAAA